jgi:hypothetical protein
MGHSRRGLLVDGRGIVLGMAARRIMGVTNPRELLGAIDRSGGSPDGGFAGPGARRRLRIIVANLHVRPFTDAMDLADFVYAFDVTDDECWAELSAAGWWNELESGAQAYVWFADRGWFSVDAEPIASFGVSIESASTEEALGSEEFLAKAGASGVRVGTYWGGCPSLSLSTPLANVLTRDDREMAAATAFARRALIGLYECAPPGFDKDARPIGCLALPQLYRHGFQSEPLDTGSLAN